MNNSHQSYKTNLTHKNTSTRIPNKKPFMDENNHHFRHHFGQKNISERDISRTLEDSGDVLENLALWPFEVLLVDAFGECD